MSEQDEENLDSLNETTEEVENTEEVEETGAQSETEDTGPKYTELEMKLHARAKKAEADNKRLKAELSAKVESPVEAEALKSKDPVPPKDDVDEKILRATKGYDDDAIEELKFIAERQGVSLFAAEQDKRFVRYVKEADEEKKKADAALPGSKGSARKQAQPSFSDPLTAEQHRELAAKHGII